MSLQQSMIDFNQERRNKERLLAWRFKIDCLKRNNGHLVPSFFAAESSDVVGAKLLVSDTAAHVVIGSAL